MYIYLVWSIFNEHAARRSHSTSRFGGLYMYVTLLHEQLRNNFKVELQPQLQSQITMDSEYRIGSNCFAWLNVCLLYMVDYVVNHVVDQQNLCLLLLITVAQAAFIPLGRIDAPLNGGCEVTLGAWRGAPLQSQVLMCSNSSRNGNPSE